MLGTTFSIGDIPVGLVVNRWVAIDFEKPQYKAVSGYYDRLTERPGYRCARPKRDALSAALP